MTGTATASGNFASLDGGDDKPEEDSKERILIGRQPRYPIGCRINAVNGFVGGTTSPASYDCVEIDSDGEDIEFALGGDPENMHPVFLHLGVRNIAKIPAMWFVRHEKVILYHNAFEIEGKKFYFCEPRYSDNEPEI